ncbi:MAG: hypothetical protein EOO61_22775, partial [Hymenobacter sp.]
MTLRQRGKCLSVFLLLLLFTLTTFAQSRVITGKVTNQDDNQPLASVNVTQKGTVNATITDTAGNYTITLVAGANTLVFSYVGYAPQEVLIGPGNTLSISLSNTTPKLDEVVVIGYGTQRR